MWQEGTGEGIEVSRDRQHMWRGRRGEGNWEKGAERARNQSGQQGTRRHNKGHRKKAVSTTHTKASNTRLHTFLATHITLHLSMQPTYN